MHEYKLSAARLLALCALLPAMLCSAAKEYEAPQDYLVDPALPYSNVELTLAPGDLAPDFTLPSADGEDISLSDYRGKQNVLLLFYRGSWCPYCVSQLADIQNILPKLASHNVQLLAVSRDKDTKSAKLAEHFDQPYLFLSDRKLNVAESYGIKRNMFLSHPAVFLVDTEGTVRWYYANSDKKMRPSPAQLMRVIKSLTPSS